jgi:hypothetical protein
MVVNFRGCGISQNARKLTRTPKLIIIKKIKLNKNGLDQYCNVFLYIYFESSNHIILNLQN